MRSSEETAIGSPCCAPHPPSCAPVQPCRAARCALSAGRAIPARLRSRLCASTASARGQGLRKQGRRQMLRIARTERRGTLGPLDVLAQTVRLQKSAPELLRHKTARCSQADPLAQRKAWARAKPATWGEPSGTFSEWSVTPVRIRS